MVVSAVAALKQTQQELATWLTRNEVAAILDVTYDRIAALEEEGKLHGKKRRGPSGAIIVYDPHEVVLAKTKRPPTRKGELPPGVAAARAFSMFNEGKSVREVVIATRQTVDVVEGLRVQWAELGEETCVITPKQRAMLVALVGSFDSVVELIEKVDQLVNAGARCTIDAAIDAGVSDAEAERAIVAALDAAGAP